MVAIISTTIFIIRFDFRNVNIKISFFSKICIFFRNIAKIEIANETEHNSDNKEVLKCTQLAARIVDQREKVNMSQSELAKRLGIDKSSMNKIEKGTRKVSSEELDKIASIFDVSTDYLLGRSTPDKKHLEHEIDLDRAIDNAMSFDGKPVTEHDRKMMKQLWKAYMAGKE